jgi:CheY-like chemotaxis protein
MNTDIATLPRLVLVDNDGRQLEILTLIFRMFGYSVLAFSCPVAALTALAQPPLPRVDLAVVDYEMPMMNGATVAHYLRACYPRLKIVLHSGASVVPENDLNVVDSLVRKGTGVLVLLQEVSRLRCC